MSMCSHRLWSNGDVTSHCSQELTVPAAMLMCKLMCRQRLWSDDEMASQWSQVQGLGPLLLMWFLATWLWWHVPTLLTTGPWSFKMTTLSPKFYVNVATCFCRPQDDDMSPHCSQQSTSCAWHDDHVKFVRPTGVCVTLQATKWCHGLPTAVDMPLQAVGELGGTDCSHLLMCILSHRLLVVMESQWSQVLLASLLTSVKVLVLRSWLWCIYHWLS